MWRSRLKSLLEWRWFAALNSLVIAALIISLLSRGIGFQDLRALLSRLQPEWVLAALPMGLLTVFAAALRTRDIYSREAGWRLPLLPVFRLLLVGQFMAYAAPIALASDIARVGLFRLRFGVPLHVSARATFVDRVVGALGLVAMGSLTFFLQPMLAEPRALALFQATVLAGAGGLVAAILLTAWLAPNHPGWASARAILALARRLVGHFRGGDFLAKQTLYALLFVGFAGGTLWTTSKALGLQIPIAGMLAFTPLILFVNNLPFLYAGWGGRELIMVVALGAIGVSRDEALLASISYGLVMLVVALPGAAFWLTRPTFRKTPTSRSASPPPPAAISPWRSNSLHET